MSEQLDLLEGLAAHHVVPRDEWPLLDVLDGVGVCSSCGREHFSGNWMDCDDCGGELRAWLKWSVDLVDCIRIVHAMAAQRLLEAP